MNRWMHRGLISLVIVASCFAAVVKAADEPRVPDNIRQLMQDRKYEGAVTAIEALTAKKPADDEPEKFDRDYLAYLKGRALQLDHQYDEAVTAYDKMNADFPKSDWARRARFAKGVTLARKGDFKAAEAVYRAEAEYLLSEKRKGEIADIYLEFADAFFSPPKKDEVQPDFQQALEYFTKAQGVGPEPRTRELIELRIAQCHQALGQHADAAAKLEAFIKQHPDSQLLIEAKFRLGESRLAEGNAVQARRVWQDLLAAHKGSANERVAEAAYKISLTYNMPTPQSEAELDLGVASLAAFIKQFPDHKLASEANLRIAQSYAHRGRYIDAVKSLETFIADKRYAEREEIPAAQQLLGQALQLQKKYDEALAAWREYLAKYPTHSGWSAVQQAIIDTELLKAEAAFADKKFDDARKLYGEFLAKYPLDGRNQRILYRFGQMLYQEEKYEEAIAEWRKLVSKYPESNEASQAQLMIGVTLEEKLGKLADALKEYRKLTWGHCVPRAAHRIARLTAKNLEVVTDRIFRSGESPKLTVTTRNIEKLTVRVYSVDLETYFRKMHLARGVEGLDIALIDPDKTFEFAVPKYQEHQQLESEIEVALPQLAGENKDDKEQAAEPNAGVLAVTVSSDTLEATTLVVKSDLDVIVKSSRDEVLVFAQNLKTGQPWPKARVLLSNGEKVFAEATTGEDGVLKATYEELKNAGDVRVFAIDGGHAASNIVSLSGVSAARGLANKGYIYTDRPAYRPGQMVHVRGVIRQVDGDAYTVAKDKPYKLSVFDNRNRLLSEADVKLNDFGSFHSHLLLPPSSALGEYRVLVADEAGQESYQGTFVVHQYQLEPVQIEVETERNVYYRGEELAGKIRVSYYYGAPVVGREIQYTLAGDDRVLTGKTDDKGEIAFKFDTREFAEAQPLQLTATLPERGLSTARIFFLATQGFRIETTTPRDVYLAGDTFEVNVKTLDAEGKPLAQDLKLSVLEKTVVDGKVGERLAAAHDVKTDAKTGAAKQTLKLADGGRYVLRWEGTDRFGNPITGESAVLISGDDDDVRLRILADAHTFKVGDEATIELHWRNEPAMALVTFEGARILDYRLVQLAKGENKLTFPVSEKLAPNFNLSIAVMSDAVAAVKVVDDGEPDAAKKPQQAESKSPPQRFHTADSPFAVERALNIKLAIVRKDGKGEPRPGDDVEVTITATDPQGKPVSAELSLAMVEQALLTQFGDPLSEIQAFFRGDDREPSMRTTSSITFRYTPTTSAINSRLLAESERLAVAEDERRRLEALQGEGGLDFAGDAPVAVVGVGGVELPNVDESSIPLDEPANDPFGGEQVTLDERSFDDTSNSYGNQPQAPFVTSVVPAIQGQQRLGVNAQGWFGGQGGLGGGGSGQQADMEALIDQITATVRPNSWEQANGSGYIKDFSGKLSLVVSQTQEVPRGQGGYQYFAKLAKDNNNELQYIQRDGTWANLNLGRALGGKFDVKRAELLATELNDRGALVMPQLPPHETAYWNPTVVTDAKGEAKITITLPERSTAWQLLAKGTTAGTLAGEAGDELVVKKDLFGQLKLPAAFTDGDKARVGVSVHNAAIDKGEVTVTLTSKLDGKSVTQTKKIPAKTGIEELVFEIDIALPADAAKIGAPGATAQFDLTVESGDAKDTALAVVEVKPFGTPVFAIAGGTAEADAIAFITPPAGMPLASPRLQILLGPTVERSLLDMVLAPATWCQAEQSYLAAGSDQTVSDLMASLALLKLVSAGRDDGNPQAEALDARVRATLSSLVAGQNDDGGWSWTIGVGGVSNAFNSARVVWALSLAKSAGYRVPEDNFNSATTYLTSQLAATGVADYEAKSILLHALTVAGRSDFTLANQLHRNRNAISSAGLAHLALTFAAMDRKQTAAELLGVLAKRPFAEAGSKRTDAANSLPWNHAEAELRALYALGLEEAAPGDADLAKQVDWLLAHRVGNRWSPDKATGPAALVLTQWFARTKFKSEKYTLTIWVNDLKAKEIAVDADALTQTIDVPSELLDPKADAKQTIRFEITGRGRFTYQCVLGGFVPADKLVSMTKDWRVERFYEPAPRELDGREIPRGFDVVQGNFETFRNPLTQLPVAQRGQVMLNVWRNNVPNSTPESHLEYLVVTEPLPAGVTVIESSVKGGFERFEILPGAITFYVGSRAYIEPIRYDVHGYLPGSYRAAPTMVHDAYGPDAMAVATLKTLDVLPQGEASKDNYRLTPRELYELGQRQFAKHDFAAALPHLSELVDKWNVRPEPYKEAVRMLLDIHVEKGPAAAIVKYFEIVVEKYPDLEVSFDKLVKIASAYTKLGEYERGYLVFRTTVETSFLKESQVAGVLEDRGQFQRSVDVMSALLRQYPPEAYTASATYALAQRTYAKAPEAAGDAKLREQKITRVDLIRRALVMLDGFLTAWPEDPAADQAAFSLASAMLDLDIFEETIAVSKRYVERYPESDYLDSFWYIMAFCHYARGEHDEALAMSQKVADAKRRDRATGREIESPNRNRAIYIMGQIYHSLGQAAKAITEYDRVKQYFVDAQQAIDYFQRKEIKLPEVTTFEPGKPAEVELKFRNVAVCDTKVYRIDLVKFGLLKRNLEGIRDINLAGIRPLHEEENKLGDGKDYRDRTEKLALPLKEEGAYLVVCRGENLHTSGLVLVSPLKVEVQEDAESGLVRTTVRNVVKDAYVDDVHVKVIGSANDDFIAGETDLRGVFVADQIQGTSTVLARADTGEYAFYRGEKYLGTPPQANQEPAQQQLEGKPQQGRGKGAAKEELLEQLRLDNSDIQREQNENLQNFYRNDIKGGAPAEAVLK